MNLCLSELMLLGFISLLLTATSSTISNICIPSKFYDSTFAPCTRSEVDEENEGKLSQGRKLLMGSILPHPFRRILNELDQNRCKEACGSSLYFIELFWALILDWATVQMSSVHLLIYFWVHQRPTWANELHNGR